MGKEIITFCDNDIEKRKFHSYRRYFLEGIDNILILRRFLLVRKIINTLLVAWMMITKLNNNTQYF